MMMARDKRTYQFAKDTRLGRTIMAESSSQDVVVEEVTRYVADIRKARDLLDWTPTTPLDGGIPKAVAWFREWREAHPEEDRPLVEESHADELEHGFKQPAGAGA